jgi:Putative polyhydroxyalkanoic acid system protein (PHA_gran_rgn)
MRIERPHKVGKPEAIRRLDQFPEELKRRELPAGVVITEASKSWSGDVMTFSFATKKGFLGTTIPGTVQVKDSSLVLDLDVPGIVTTFVPEEKIREAINKELDKLL